MKPINEWTRYELFSLPLRQWNEVSEYDSIAILPTLEHESGFLCMAIIGVRKGVPIEIATQCSDDLAWCMDFTRYGSVNLCLVRTECLLVSSALHFYSKHGSFIVHSALSTISIEFNRSEK